jgi:tetratricopeptide (TPR) repeat protein
MLVMLAPAVIVGLGCGPGEQPAPVKLEKQSPFDRGATKPDRDPNDPFRDPATEVPRGRDGDQLSAEEIDATLAEAAKFAEIKDTAQERNVLRNCANKTPASARCDGRLGLSLIPAKNRRATALYYLREAAVADDPKADAALYMEIGEWLRKFGNNDHAVLAMTKAIERDPSAENLFAFGRLLSLVPDRLGEGADRIAEARAKDDRVDWLYEEAVIRGQIPVREQAEQSLALFKEYLVRAESVPADSLPAAPASLAGRMAELDELRKHYPTQAEYDKTKAAAPTPEQAPAPEPEPT